MDRAADALNRLGVRLESWRSENSAPTPIPTDIWKRASELAGDLGVGRVAKALRLDYSRLKKLASGSTATPLERSVLARPLTGFYRTCLGKWRRFADIRIPRLHATAFAFFGGLKF